MPSCYCTYFNCNGELVDDKTRKRHERFDKSQAYHRRAEFQPNENSVQGHPESELQGAIPILSTQINVSGGTCKVESREGHTRHYQTNVSTLQSLVELEQRVAAQTRATKALRSRTAALLPARSLVDEIKTHRMEMETMLANLTVLWCSDGSTAMRMKENLTLQLREGIED
ncbi:hypothetical protein EDB86DRAFT_2837041 [Lactarius hatsudake]|nr:hypothetical protein EDB86DRAFT_2837041 [Lactarius hatsudake]